MRSLATSLHVHRRQLALAVLAAALLALPAGADANVPFKRISAPGPIESIWIGNDMSCQAKLTEDSVNSFYPPALAPGDCGLLIATGGVVYSPNWAFHDDTGVTPPVPAAGTPFTPVSQSNVTGSGTAANPFQVVTVATIPELASITRTDRYVVGSDSWNINIRLLNDGTEDTVVAYHAGDCYLAGSDLGFGAVNATTGAVFCTSTPHNSPPGRVIGFGPSSTVSSSGGAFVQGHHFDDVWQRTDGSLYPNVCFSCGVKSDNGAGLSWSRHIPAGGTVDLDLGSTVKAPRRCAGRTATIVGRPGARVVRGTGKADVIVAGAGRQVIRARGGADLVCAGPGKDRVLGGPGRDRVFGQGGNDELVGGKGPDLLRGGPGRDLLRGGPGRDRMHGGPGRDRCFGGPGRDRAQSCELRKGI